MQQKHLCEADVPADFAILNIYHFWNFCAFHNGAPGSKTKKDHAPIGSMALVSAQMMQPFCGHISQQDMLRLPRFTSCGAYPGIVHLQTGDRLVRHPDPFHFQCWLQERSLQPLRPFLRFPPSPKTDGEE